MALEQPVAQDSDVPEDTTSVAETLPETEEPSLEAGDEDLHEEQTTEDPDLEDEVDGVKVRGKKDLIEKLKSERLMQADYTRKTQEVAEQRKAFEAERAQHQQLTQAHLLEVGQLVAIDTQLAQFAKVDWQAASDANPAEAQKAWFQFQQLQGAKAQLINNLTQKRQQADLEQQHASAKQRQEAEAVLTRDIKGWSPELQSKLRETGKAAGYNDDELKSITDPRAVKLLHKAHLYDQLMSKRQAPKAPAPPPEPVARVNGGGANGQRRLSQMSDAEFIKARQNYVRNHR